MTDDGFEAFVREYQDMVFATAVRLLGDPAEAEDMAQTAFLKAFERFAQIGGSPAAAGWLKTVTTNLCLNHLRRYRQRWRLFSEVSDDAAQGDAFADRVPARGTPDAHTILEEADRDSRLERALHALPDPQRVPLVLFHFEHKSYQEIAEMLGVSLAKVKTDIHRGREALRRHVTDDAL